MNALNIKSNFQRYNQETTTDMVALNEAPSNIIKYDFINQKVIDIIEEESSITSQTEEKYTNQQGHIPVQPIVGEDIQRVKDYILNRPVRYKNSNYDFNLRDYAMFCFNINIGLRIGDFLRLKISDILVNGKIVDYICIYEQKTKKTKTKNIKRNPKPPREILLLPEVQDILMQYINSLVDWKPEWYLFHGIWPEATPYKEMTRQNVWEKMKKIKEELEFNVPLGTHSMRKTFARALFDRLSLVDPMAILVIQELLGHSSPEVTLRYIGITREKRNDLRLQAGLI